MDAPFSNLDMFPPGHLRGLKARKVGKQARQVDQSATPSPSGVFQADRLDFALDAKTGQNGPPKAGMRFMLAGFRKPNPNGLTAPGGRDIAPDFLCDFCALVVHKRKNPLFP
jgi:hypothetical protein